MTRPRCHRLTAVWLVLGALWLAAWPAQAQGRVVEYIHTDALGSVVAVTDQNRNVIERREYEPYGKQLTPAVEDGPGYTGHVQDAATGLVYMQQRYYDPMLGRFLSVDPVTIASGGFKHFSRYTYATNNPYRYYDPNGRCTGSRISNSDGTCKITGEFTTLAISTSSRNARRVSSVFSHSSVATSGGDGKPSKFPKETRSALGKFLGSSVGGAIGRYAVSAGEKIALEQILPGSGYKHMFQTHANSNLITYTLRWRKFLASHEFGYEFAGAGLDVLLAHEIGHTQIAGAVFGYDPYTDNANNDEFNAVGFLENPYRDHLGLPLRTHYTGIPIP